MNDWFMWNGEKSTDHHMRVLAQPPIVRAEERVEFVTVPGRSGTLTLTEGEHVYKDKNLSALCVIDEPYEVVDGKSHSRIADICGWLKGGGNVTFANQPEGFYKGRVANQISFDKIVRGNPHRSFSVEFICNPFLYLYSGMTEKTIHDGYSLHNDGNIYSEPVLKVTGSGNGTIMCGNSTMLINDLNEVPYITIDCEAKLAYKGTPGNALDPFVLLTTRVTGDWLTIPENQSSISISGNIDTVTIIPKWRCV